MSIACLTQVVMLKTQFFVSQDLWTTPRNFWKWLILVGIPGVLLGNMPFKTKTTQVREDSPGYNVSPPQRTQRWKLDDPFDSFGGCHCRNPPLAPMWMVNQSLEMIEILLPESNGKRP